MAEPERKDNVLDIESPPPDPQIDYEVSESDDSPIPPPPKLERQTRFYNLATSRTKPPGIKKKMCEGCGARSAAKCKRGCGVEDYCKKCQHTKHRVCPDVPPVLIYERKPSTADLTMPKLEFELEVERQHVAELKCKLAGMQELYEKQKHDNFIRLASAEQQYDKAIQELKQEHENQILVLKKSMKEESQNMKSQIEAFRAEYAKVQEEEERAMQVAQQIQKVKSLKKKIKDKHDEAKFDRLSKGGSSTDIKMPSLESGGISVQKPKRKRGRPKKK